MGFSPACKPKPKIVHKGNIDKSVLSGIVQFIHSKKSDRKTTVREEGGKYERKGKSMIVIDYKSRMPIYEQLVERIRALALDGVFAPGEKLPSVRQLSSELGINPNTVQRAYNTLVGQGVVDTAPGKGIFISNDLQGLLKENRQTLFARFGADVCALKAAGVSKEEVLKAAETSYDGEGSKQ